MNPEGVPIALILWVCSGAFWLIGWYAATRKDPMHFWAGTKIPPEKITDLAAYNRACARMWCGYAACWTVLGGIALISPPVSGVCTFALGFGGLFALIGIWNRIYRRYERK